MLNKFYTLVICKGGEKKPKTATIMFLLLDVLEIGSSSSVRCTYFPDNDRQVSNFF